MIIQKKLSLITTSSLIAATLSMSAAAFACPVQIETSEGSYRDFNYIEENDGSLYLTRYTGNGGNVVIPTKINGKKVSGIGVKLTDDGSGYYHSFYSGKTQVSFTIPNGITKIGDYTFCECTALKSVTLPNTITEISHASFYGCTSLKTITIPSGVKKINKVAFYGCTSLTTVIIPNSVEEIPTCAFENCPNLTIYGSPGSYAEKYAKWCNINFTALEPFSLGDLTGDGYVDILDAKWMLQAAAGSRTLTEQQRSVADVNKDGYADILDAKWLLQAAAGSRTL